VITTNTLTISSCKAPGCSFTLPTIPTLRGKIALPLPRSSPARLSPRPNPHSPRH
jgi:hypothetical protein